MTAEEVLSSLSWRYAVKKFDRDKRISDRDWSVLEESLRLTPSSFGLQLWRFIVIDSPELREALKPHAWDQQQITNCSHLVAFTHKTNPLDTDIDEHIQNLSRTRNLPLESLRPYRARIGNFVEQLRRENTVHHWTARQTYLALGFFMSAAARLEIDTCPMEGFEQNKVDTVLGLDGSCYSTSVLCAAGYRASDDSFQSLPKVRYPNAQVIVHK